MSDVADRHPYLRRLEGSNDLLIRDEEDFMHRFTAHQVRLYCKFDFALRNGKFDPKKGAYAGGYDAFAHLWNRATNFTYRFSTLEEDGITVSVNGEHPDADRIAPLPTPAKPPPRFSDSQEDAIQGLLWDLAARDTRKRKRIDESRAQRKQKRAYAEEEKVDMVFGGLLDNDEELEQFDGMTKIRRNKKTGGRDETPVAGPSGTRRARAESVAESVVEVEKDKDTDAMADQASVISLSSTEEVGYGLTCHSSPEVPLATLAAAPPATQITSVTTKTTGNKRKRDDSYQASQEDAADVNGPTNLNFHYTLDYDNTDDEYPYKAMCVDGDNAHTLLSNVQVEEPDHAPWRVLIRMTNCFKGVSYEELLAIIIRCSGCDMFYTKEAFYTWHSAHCPSLRRGAKEVAEDSATAGNTTVEGLV
ncbi:hypothetical protein OH76DRAFT_1423605 [Lentinus brumalis]|uniref:Uncharacterized protein n=1 Tax=Lentinus brumalis TaxID=2498619 RepID=A0A371CK32_9APHY|nr:hypothetical protein OH76DRAFT_1423605 [Polyporus brumalis]